MKKLLILSTILLSLTAIGADPADVVIRNGKIVTVDSDFHIAEAMAVRDGRIASVGKNKEIGSLIGPQTKVVDLEGNMVLPGLINSHTHPSGASRYEADHEIPSMESVADVLAYVRQRATVVPKGEWITLSQVFITRLREQRFPGRVELDEAAPDHPVVFRTGPDGNSNSLALKENGSDKEFAAKHPGNVMVDPRTGEPNGILRRASSVLKAKPNSKRKHLTEAERDERLVMLFDDYNRSGITAIIDRNCNDSSRYQFERLLKSNRLSVRFAMSRGLSPNGKLSDIQQRLDTIAAATGSSRGPTRGFA